MAASSLKIGFVLDDSLDKADGVQQYVLAVGEWLRSKGHDVHYLVSTTTRTDVANIHSLGKNVAVRFNGNRMSMPLPASKRAIRALLVREKFDVLHVQLPYSPWLAQRVIATAGPRTAVFGTFHIVPHAWHVRAASRALAVWTRSSLKRFDGIVSVSSAAQEFARQAFGLETAVLPNVVDTARFKHAKPFTRYAGRPTVVFLGRLVPRKGCQTLLEAVRLLQASEQSLPQLRVVICGKGPLEAQLKTFVQKHNLTDTIEFAGFVDEADKPRYLQSADIAVYPSTGGESFGIVLVEAMAAGALVLAGDNPGYHTVMAPRPELLFRPHDAQLLADKLALFIRQPTKRRTLVKWQSEYVQQFDTQVVGKELVHKYNQALRSRQNVQ